MHQPSLVFMPDRGVVLVKGKDARRLLNSIVTNDLDQLDKQDSIFAGLLSPQGKILFDFIISTGPDGDDYLLDTDRSQAPGLVKRLKLYRLKAEAEISDWSDTFSVFTSWMPPGVHVSEDVDPRDSRLGWRGPMAALGPDMNVNATPATYHARRISLGIPEGGKDYDFGDAFPHEANFDLLNGVSFDKGCYVGQEIVARMEHRGTVRKRIVRVTAAAELPADRPDVVMGEVVIGKLGSVAGRQGLALIRLDRAIEAIDKGTAVTAAGIPLVIDPDMIARQRKLMAEKAANP